MAELTAEDLAAELAAHFNALADKPIQFQATKPAEVPTVENELADWSVFVLPFGETETPFDRADACREEYEVSVFVVGPIKGAATKEKGVELTKFLRNSLRETEFLGLDWAGNEIDGLYDGGAVAQKKMFYTLFRATYYRFA